MATVPARPRAEPVPARFVTIEGRKAQVVEMRSELPPTLDVLLGALTVVASFPKPRVGGFARACADQDHDFVRWLAGMAIGRELRLSMCVHCGTVEVRDVSLDRRSGLPTGGQELRRRDAVLGWYSGKRAAGRVYL